MKKILLAICLFVGAASLQAQVSTDTTLRNVDSAINFNSIFDSFLDSLLTDKPAKEIVINPALQKKYLPDGLNVFIGTTKDELIKKRPALKKSSTDLLDYPTEKVTKFGKIAKITYQLSNGKVYEFIFEFTKATTNKQVIDWAINKVGKPNDGKEWLIELKDGLKLKMWVFQNKFCVADSRQF